MRMCDDYDTGIQIYVEIFFNLANLATDSYFANVSYGKYYKNVHHLKKISK